MKRKLVSFLLVCATLMTLVIPANAAVVHEVIEEKELMGGVTYQHIQRLDNVGWQDIYVVQADLNAPGVKLEVLKSKKGESYLENTCQMAEDSDALAAINADFFASKRGQSGRGSAVGVEVRDGELKSSASVTENMNTLYQVFGENRFHLNPFTFDITVTAQDGRSDKIKVVNKYDDLTGIVMYTDDWGDKAVGSVGDCLEVSVDKNGVVLEKVREQDPLTIPNGGYVLASHLGYNTFLLDHVNVGDTISVNVTSKPNVDLIETAVGGGGILVSEGVACTKFSHNISGRHPRSAVGLDQTGTVITLVAVDGRRSDAKGMTQAELGVLMQELGCYSALNFDGGGSTLMAVEKDGKTEVVNKPSDGVYRKVTNSLGIVSVAEENAPMEKAVFDIEDAVFVGGSMVLQLIGVDAYQRKTDFDNSGAVYFPDNGGTVTENVFYATEVGEANITAECGGFFTERTINVLDKPREMNFEQEKIRLNSGEDFYPVIVGKDAGGKKAKIRLADCNLSFSNQNAYMEGNRLIAKSKGTCIVTATFGDITANMAVMIDGASEVAVPDNVVVADTQNKSQAVYAPDGVRFAVFGNTRSVNTLFDRFLMNRAFYDMKKKSDFQVFIGGDIHSTEIAKVLPNYVLAKNYNCFGDGENTFIMLPNTSGKVYTGDATIWSKFRADVSKSHKNLFVFLDRNYISEHPAELLSFTKIVNDAAAKGKNVYVFGGGFVNQNTIDDGVRYVNTAGIFPSIAIDGTSASFIKYVLVTVNGTDVTYEYKQVIGE